MRKRTKVLIGAAIAVLLVMAFAIPALARGPLGGDGYTDGICEGVCDGDNTRIGFGGYGASIGECEDVVAELTGYTEEEIQEMRLDGKSLVEIAAFANVDEETLIDALLEEHQTKLDELLDEGTITEDQYDTMLANMTERIEEMVNRTETGRPSWAGGFGMRGGFDRGYQSGDSETGFRGTCGGGMNRGR